MLQGAPGLVGVHDPAFIVRPGRVAVWFAPATSGYTGASRELVKLDLTQVR